MALRYPSLLQLHSWWDHFHNRFKQEKFIHHHLILMHKKYKMLTTLELLVRIHLVNLTFTMSKNPRYCSPCLKSLAFLFFQIDHITTDGTILQMSLPLFLNKILSVQWLPLLEVQPMLITKGSDTISRKWVLKGQKLSVFVHLFDYSSL